MKRRILSAVDRIYLHHIAWGLTTIGLLFLLFSAWGTNRELSTQTQQLERQVAQLQAAESCTAHGTWQAGATQAFTLTVDDLERRYLVHLPDDFTPDTHYPMMLFFAGKGSRDIDGAAMGFTKLPAVTVFPDSTVGKDGYHAWQGAPYSSEADDVRFVNDIIDKLTGQLCIDRSRIYAAGWSNGGGLAALLSCQLSSRIAAIGVAAGAYYEPFTRCTPTRPLPVMSIHGDADTSVPFNGSLARHLPSINSWTQGRAEMNGCHSVPYTTRIGSSRQAHTWQYCANNATVYSVVLQGGSHAWEPEFIDMFWNFLSAHQLQN